ncbi:FtsX-like permease family protein [Fictibacillus iocasae]|uniref:FtsX-like permease family protein n=1 Tax=Fictibacillus iocasae TaxID=2715437 RepID=A0ABW2NLV8_9BACL
MNNKQLIWRSLKKNLAQNVLYVFALVFSVALYFSFVTLQYDPAMDTAKNTVKGGAAIRTASVLLVAIVAVFLVYANAIFIKRRSKEIGLFQLIGMTKRRIFYLLSAENAILYVSSLLAGIFFGFAFSRLITMILFRITGVDAVAVLHFSGKALLQTILIFTAIYMLILLMNYLFIKKQTILSLFAVRSTTEERVKKLSKLEIMMGIAGLVLIITGYYVSSELFGGSFRQMTELFLAMAFILASVIIGTYLFYKGSVSFVLNIIRKKKDGYVTVREVLSLTSIMFRMKSNAMLLTIITTVSALAIGLLSLSYISYYSSEKTAENNVPAHFSLTDSKAAEKFKKMLASEMISYREVRIDVLMANANMKDILLGDTSDLLMDPSQTSMAVISDAQFPKYDVKRGDVLFAGYNDLMQKFLPLKNKGTIELKGKSEAVSLEYKGLKKEYPISWYFIGEGQSTAVVDDSVYRQLKKNLEPSLQKEHSEYIGIDITDKKKWKKANKLFVASFYERENGADSRLEMISAQRNQIGLAMFIVGFLGLTFLITSGCILYFKQMDESEEERPNYTILRKLGYTVDDLSAGIKLKQWFSFGIPLSLGLIHSYFAVQSGWFLFGAEVYAPMTIVMIIYTALYSVFGFLSLVHYKKVIKAAL